MGIIRNLGLLFLAFAFVGCNATRVVKPLDKGEKQLAAGFGGPGIIYTGAPIPVPLTSVSYAHGLDTGLSLSAGLHTTSAAFGVIQSDIAVGISAFQSKSEKFGVTVTPAINFLYDFYENNGRTYPQLDALSWWQYGEKDHLLYGGVGTWIELRKRKAHEQVQNNEVLPWITVGHQFNMEKWSYMTEFKYLGFQHETDLSVVDYVSPGGRGTIGFYFGISRSFGK